MEPRIVNRDSGGLLSYPPVCPGSKWDMIVLHKHASDAIARRLRQQPRESAGLLRLGIGRIGDLVREFRYEKMMRPNTRWKSAHAGQIVVVHEFDQGTGHCPAEAGVLFILQAIPD